MIKSYTSYQFIFHFDTIFQVLHAEYNVTALSYVVSHLQ